MEGCDVSCLVRYGAVEKVLLISDQKREIETDDPGSPVPCADLSCRFAAQIESEVGPRYGPAEMPLGKLEELAGSFLRLLLERGYLEEIRFS